MKTVLDLYQSAGFSARRKTSGEFEGPCPGCGGRDRFIVFADQGKNGEGRFWCRQCSKGGDAIQFLMDFRGLSYPDACREIGREPKERSASAAKGPGGGRAGGASAPAVRPWEPRPSEEPSAAWQAKARALAESAARSLQASPRVLTWLAHERGVLPETAERFGLGWIAEDLYRDRAAWGLPAVPRTDGRPKRLWLPAGLVIPWRQGGEGGQGGQGSRILRLKIRRATVRENEPRYYVLPSEPRNVAPMRIETGARAWAVVESELDGVLLAQEAAGLVNVMVLGSAANRPDAEGFALLAASPFTLVSLDFDDAGNKSAWTWWAERLSHKLPPDRLRVWPVPEGKDPCEAWGLGWNLRDWIAGGLPPYLLPPKPARAGRWTEAPADVTSTSNKLGKPGKNERPEAVRPETSARETTAAPAGMANAEEEGHARPSRRRKRLPPSAVRGYRKGRAWILQNLAELERLGWSRARLFRAGRTAYGSGRWGLAWAESWADKRLETVEIEPDGAVVFVIREPHRAARLAARP